MKNKHKTTIDRLLEFMEYKKLNDNKITKLAGLSVGLIGRARKNNTGLHTDTIEKILFTFPELNPTWLLTGKGEMVLPLYEDFNEMSSSPDNKKVDTCLIKDIFTTQREIITILKQKYFKEEL